MLAENVNLAIRMPGVIVSGGGCPACAVDEDNSTKWVAAGGTLEIQFPSDVTVSQLRLVGTRQPSTERTSAGRFELLGANDVIRYASGPVEILGPLFDATLVLPNLTGVRRVRFTPTATTGNLYFTGISELKVIGSALIERRADTSSRTWRSACR